VVDLRGFNFQDQNDRDSIPQNLKDTMRWRGKTDSYYLATVVMGYKKLRPNTHGPLCSFIDTCKVNRRLIQMPRSHFKTVCVTVVKRTQEVLNQPHRRILIVGDTGPNAQNHLNKIKLQFEGNPVLRWLYPERCWEDTSKAPKWSKEQLYLPVDINGNTALHGEPTFDAIGAGGAVVSRHYDTINADDLIGEDEFYSETEMSKKIDWFSNLEALYVPPLEDSLMDIPSTYWRTDDVYAYAEDFWGRNQQPVATGPYSYQRGDIAVFRRGALEDGKPIFPPEYDKVDDDGKPVPGAKVVNGYPASFFERLRDKNPERYAAQYANNPRSAENAYFRPEFLRYYGYATDDGSVLYIQHDGGIIEHVHLMQLERYSLCDPHAGGTNRFRGSRAAVITVAVDPKYPRIYIADCWIKRSPTDKIVDEIFRQRKRWDPDVFSIEANGMQKMLRYWIDERTERDPFMYPEIPYKPFIPAGDKDGERRIKGLQPFFKSGQIWMSRGMTELIEEYSSWPRGLKDGLDCLSQMLGLIDTGFQSTSQELQNYEDEVMRQFNVATGY
jgi:hypothetical protein